jgi:CheY-like chemotaxis protein
MKRILLIDDDPLVRLSVQRVLKAEGYDVHLAKDGVEGLKAFRHLRPDLVITDILMPVKEGLDTIRLLQTWSPDTKVIAISGGNRGNRRDLLAEAAQLGACAVLTKPFEPEDLLLRVSQSLAAAQVSQDEGATL